MILFRTPKAMNTFVDKIISNQIYLSKIIYDRQTGRILATTTGILPSIIVTSEDYSGLQDFGSQSDDFIWSVKTCQDWNAIAPDATNMSNYFAYYPEKIEERLNALSGME